MTLKGHNRSVNSLELFLSVSVFQAWEAVRLEFLGGGSSSATYREKLINYFSQQLRCLRVAILSSCNKPHMSVQLV